MSRSLRSGFGFSEEDDELRGDNRAKITANIMRPWVNTVITNYTANPFGIGVKRYDGQNASTINEIVDYVQSKCDFTDLATNALESVLNDGYCYVLVGNELDNPTTNSQYPKPVLLDSDRLFMDDCEDATGADCDMAIYVSVIKKTKAESIYKINRNTLQGKTDPFSKYDFVSDTTYYTTVATIYERVEGGVQVSKMCHGIIIDEPVLLANMTRLPIVRIASEKVWLPSTKQEHYRGAYWFVYDLMKVINFQMSLHAERVATAPTAKLLVDSRAIEGKKKYWDNLNKSPLAYAEYNSFDESGNPIPVPIPMPQDKDYTDLITGVQSMTTMVTNILGAPTGEPPKNETEVGVLLRKSISEATANRYIKALCEGMEAIGEVILSWLPILFDVSRTYNNKILESVSDVTPYYIVVDSGPIVASQQQKTVAQLMAVDNLIAKNPQSKVTPVIIKNLDIPMESKQEILAGLMGPIQAPVDPAMQQAMMDKDNQLMQAQKIIEDQGKQIASLQIQMNEFVDDSEIKIRIAQMDNETKIYLKRLELAANNEELQAKLQSDFLNQQARLQSDLMKERMKLQTPVTDVPVFNRGRFV